MPRSIWNGTISFGMVHVPIKLYSATESRTVHFREVHAKDGARIEHRRICPREETEVPYGDVVKGYEVAPDEYVVLDKEEVKAAAGARGKVIELEDFVPADEIDPVFYDRTYYLGCRDHGGEEAYRVLHEALRRSGKAGLGRFTFHNREYLAAIRALDRLMSLHTMRFHDEVVAGSELEVEAPERPPSEREVAMAEQLVESLQQEFRPDDFEDTHREAVLSLIERKAAGKEVEAAAPEQREETPDLLAALEASLGGDGSGGRGARGRAGGGRRSKARSGS